MNLVVIDPTVFVAGVFWRHEPHLCLKAWLRGMITPVMLVATTPVDLRGSFNRLYSLVIEQLKGDPLSGHLFVFTNRRRNRIKVLYWDGDGLWVCAKRLEQGRFTWPMSENGQVSLRGEEFSALIHGLEVRSKKNWYRR
jgi:transposase